MPLLNCYLLQRSLSLRAPELTHSHPSQAIFSPIFYEVFHQVGKTLSSKPALLKLECTPKSPRESVSHHQRFWFIRLSFMTENVHFHPAHKSHLSSTALSHIKSIWIAQFQISIPSVTIDFATAEETFLHPQWFSLLLGANGLTCHDAAIIHHLNLIIALSATSEWKLCPNLDCCVLELHCSSSPIQARWVVFSISYILGGAYVL